MDPPLGSFPLLRTWILLVAMTTQTTEGGPYGRLGCWTDSGDRAIPVNLEGTDPRLDGAFHSRLNAIEKCYRVVKSRGFQVFGVQDGGQCWSSAPGGEAYKKHGPSTACAEDGKGGSWANEVYRIIRGPYRSIGCWGEDSPKAIPSLELTDPRLDGDYQTRTNPIEKCYWVARERGFPMFAVLDGGQCGSSATAMGTYQLHGSANNCVNGEGESDANDVYEIVYDERCPDGYTLFAEDCFKVFPDTKTHSDAQTHCNNEGGSLAMPKDEATHQLLEYLLEREKAAGSFVGLKRVTGTDSWRWEDGSDLGSFSSWKTGEPDGQDCVKYNSNRNWVDITCSQNLGFICQVPQASEWRQLFATARGTGQKVFDAWSADSDTAVQHDKSPLVELWSYLGISKVVWESTSGDVTLTFDGQNTDKYSWFSKSRLISSPWTDLDTEPIDTFSIHDEPSQRSFLISRNHAVCGSARGWLSLAEGGTSATCTWEQTPNDDVPAILYSTATNNVAWSAGDSTVGRADRMVIYVTTVKHCPDGYTPFTEACYKIFTDEKQYTDAQTHCNNEGGHLAMPKDHATSSLLSYLARQGNPGVHYYIGLTADGNTWKWSDGSELVGFSHWAENEPNVASEECVVLLKGSNYQWADVQCSKSYSGVRAIVNTRH
ncbi:macrophage mannose receptor 1-like [Branchiostoma floridae]|uniref:Macrophage mannose receptor 1-like n=1 Tax=Branchiostoma floridae TaxID=7739 RepID=A0A9J7M126_BRAFL|nr:macrophage mannose receptor 1-like [Branchiostoma floridae]